MSDLLQRLGAALAGHYTVERELGQGGMATVFLASDHKHERKVAIKVLSQDVAAQLGSERFLREIKTAAQLNHPNILALHDSGEADGLLYYVMPHVDGGSLRERLDREGALPLDDALRIAQEVAEALHHAHSHGIVHRDIKPENILFVAGRPVVADFGIARAVTSVGAAQLTQAGMAVGTPTYMSPEQAAGDPHVDARSDIYALGCVLYEMLSGHPPFSGRNPREILARHTLDAVPPLRTARPTVPPNVDATVARALAKVPADRFATARDFADAIAGRRTAESRSITGVLLGARALMILAGYLVFAAGAWLLTQALVSRFALSPILPRFVLIGLALLVPTIMALAYTLSERGARWRAAHVAGASANLAGAAVALFLLFGDKDLGATTRAVTLTDEEGKSIQRVIPKAEFRKRIALFYFDADPRDSIARNLGYGIPEALFIDLLQDLNMDVRTPDNFRDRLRAAGHHDLTGVPLTLARTIAVEQFRDQFVMGKIETRGAELAVTMSVYRTATGEQVRQATFQDRDPLALVDKLTTELRGAAEIPERYAKTVTDLPVAELLTRSPGAFNAFVRANRALSVENDFPQAATFLERAIAADSTFAFAQYLLFITYTYQNRGQEGRLPLQAAVDLAYRLPERMRNQVKANYFEMRQEPEKMYAVTQMNAELFPGDVQVLASLMQMQLVRGQEREAIETGQQILAADPNQHDYLRVIAGIEQSLGELDQALQYFERYTRLHPEDRRGLFGTGNVQTALGRFDQARSSYERAQLLEPSSIEAALRIADLDLTIGEFEKARAGMTEALARSRSVKDSASALGVLAGYYAIRGQIRESLRYRELAWAAQARSVPPIQIMISRLQAVGDYVAAGDTAQAFAQLAHYRQQLQPPFDMLAPLGELRIALALENPAGIDSASVSIQNLVDRAAYGFLRSSVAYARGQSRYLRGEYRDAIAEWEKEKGLNPTDPSVSRQLGQAWRELGENGRAEKALEASRRLRPGDPRTRYELALLEEKRGKRDRAIEHLRAALAVWSDADPAFKWAHRAREKLTQLTGAPAGS